MAHSFRQPPSSLLQRTRPCWCAFPYEACLVLGTSEYRGLYLSSDSSGLPSTAPGSQQLGFSKHQNSCQNQGRVSGEAHT